MTPKPSQDPNEPILPPNLPLPPSDEDQATIASLANTKPVDPRSILGDQVAPGESIPGSKMHEAGKLAYASLMPKITADPGSTDYFRQRQEQIEFEKNHPYGAPISKHPGTFGTILHGLAKAGNIAGDILAPGTMSLIPGTDMNRRGQELENLAGIEHGQAEDAKEKQAQGELENAQARTKIEQQNADTAASAEKNKENESEPLFDKAGNVVGFKTAKGILAADSPEITEDMRKVAQAAKPKETPAHVTYDQGIPVSVTGKDGKVYDVNDPKLPPDLKPLVESATRAHSQAQSESADKQARAFAQQEKMFNERQNAPTNTTKTMYEAAPHVQEFVNRIEPLIAKLEKEGKLGPGAGRWNELWAGKIGAGDADFVKLRTDVGLLTTLLMRMHVGARGGEYVMQHFSDIINSGKQDPASMRAALGEISAYAQQLENDRNGGGSSSKTTESGGEAPPPGAKVRDYTQLSH